MSINVINYEALDTLLNDLDVQASLSSDRGQKWERRNPRHPFRVNCKVYCYQPNGYKVFCINGRTRNLSRNGVGLLVRRVFAPGEPIELEVEVPGRPKMFMAGQTVFCRYAGRSYYEVGVTLHAAGQNPVFSEDPGAAYDSLEWLREGLPDR